MPYYAEVYSLPPGGDDCDDDDNYNYDYYQHYDEHVLYLHYEPSAWWLVLSTAIALRFFPPKRSETRPARHALVCA